MSVKVYEAYRIKGDVFAIIQKLRDALMPVIKADLQKFLDKWAAMPKDEFVAMVKKSLPDVEVREQTPFECGEILWRLYKKQLVSPYKNWDDLDFILALRKHGRYIYIIPHRGGFWNLGAADFKEAFMSIEGMEDYMYWNNADPEDGISDEEWEARGQTWDTLDKKWSNALSLELVDHNNFFNLNYEMALERNEHKKAKNG